MIPYKIEFIMQNFQAVAMTILSFFLAISFSKVITIVPSILAIMYWIPKIYYTQVKKYHEGSWWLYFRFLIGQKNKK